MTAHITVIIALLVSAWLITCSVCDWRKREVPTWLAVIPMAMAVLWSAIYGNAPAALLAVLMLLATNFERSPAILLSIVSLAFVLFLGCFILDHTFELFLPIFIILGIALLWFFGGTGGSDAMILMSITLVFGTPALMYAIFAGGVFGVVGLAIKKKTMPYVIPITTGMIVYFATQLI